MAMPGEHYTEHVTYRSELLFVMFSLLAIRVFFEVRTKSFRFASGPAHTEVDRPIPRCCPGKSPEKSPVY